ncbi:hypothetical protein GKC29_02065 [Micromonospora sp. WMMC415]|uniref:hypothetical protein n=1 Tax=Micromonospora sp. WMMC415 TaxID=2675222 RepID=UPI0012B500F8|nr:hypothetical protein [Micromonospora sp. WMMC415]QGN45758.1 hypothetical protein GKC29_02065 [Micromonospora sp. WMMC415]
MRAGGWVAAGISALLLGAALAVPGPAGADPIPEIDPIVTAPSGRTSRPPPSTR